MDYPVEASHPPISRFRLNESHLTKAPTSPVQEEIQQPDSELTSPPTSVVQAEESQVLSLGEEKGLAETENTLPIQAKLTIGEPNDVYEKEADTVARQVVDQINAPPKIQVKAQQQPMKSVEERKPSKLEHLNAQIVQRYATGGQMTAPPDVESSIQRAKEGGQPLADGIREPMEGAFGADFSGVRVHTDAKSDELNQSIQAKAFTTGEDIFFRQGAYEPENRGGQELLAHELTHVVQQEGNRIPIVQKLEMGNDLDEKSWRNFVREYKNHPPQNQELESGDGHALLKKINVINNFNTLNQWVKKRKNCSKPAIWLVMSILEKKQIEVHKYINQAYKEVLKLGEVEKFDNDSLKPAKNYKIRITVEGIDKPGIIHVHLRHDDDSSKRILHLDRFHWKAEDDSNNEDSGLGHHEGFGEAVVQCLKSSGEYEKYSKNYSLYI